MASCVRADPLVVALARSPTPVDDDDDDAGERVQWLEC